MAAALTAAVFLLRRYPWRLIRTSAARRSLFGCGSYFVIRDRSRLSRSVSRDLLCFCLGSRSTEPPTVGSLRFRLSRGSQRACFLLVTTASAISTAPAAKSFFYSAIKNRKGVVESRSGNSRNCDCRNGGNKIQISDDFNATEMRVRMCAMRSGVSLLQKAALSISGLEGCAA